MNPDENPHATEDAPQARVLDGLITCPHCSGWIESSADCAGQIVACPHCGGHFQLPESIEREFVPPPVHRGGGGAPPREPWFYGFIDTYARVWMWFSVLVGALGVLSATFPVSRLISPFRGDHTGIVILVFIATLVVFGLWLLGILLLVAFMHLAVDIGRTLRAIHHHAPDRIR